MLFYRRNQEPEQSLTPPQIALQIVDYPNDQHWVRHPDEQEYYDFEEFPEVKKCIIEWAHSLTLYAGPSVCGMISWHEIVHRIAQEPLESHFVKGRPPSLNYSMTLDGWTDWRHIQWLYKKVAKRTSAPISQIHANQFPAIKFTRRLSRGYWFARNFKILHENFDSSKITRKTHFISYKQINGKLRANWNRWTIESTREIIRKKLLTELIETQKCVLPYIGVLTLKDMSKPHVSFQINKRFFRVLNGIEDFDPQHPLTKDGEHNLRYWLPKHQKKNASLSAFRKWIVWFGITPRGFDFAHLYLHFITYHLWSGNHVCIPNFGTFALRKHKQGRTVRFRCANALKKSIENQQNTEVIKSQTEPPPADENSFEMLYTMLQSNELENKISALSLLESLADTELCNALLQKITFERHHSLLAVKELWGSTGFVTYTLAYFWNIATRLIPDNLPKLEFLHIDNSIQEANWELIDSIPLQGFSYNRNDKLHPVLNKETITHIELQSISNIPKQRKTLSSVRHLKIRQHVMTWQPILATLHPDCKVEINFDHYRQINNLPSPDNLIRVPVNVQRCVTDAVVNNRHHRQLFMDWALSDSTVQHLKMRAKLLGTEHLSGNFSGDFVKQRWLDFLDRMSQQGLKKDIHNITISCDNKLTLHLGKELLQCKELQTIKIKGKVNISFAPEMSLSQSLHTVSLEKVTVDGSLMWLAKLPKLKTCNITRSYIKSIPSIDEMDRCPEELRQQLLPHYIPPNKYVLRDEKSLDKNRNQRLITLLSRYLSPVLIYKLKTWQINDHFRQVILSYVSKHAPELVSEETNITLTHEDDIVLRLSAFPKLNNLNVEHATANPTLIIANSRHVEYISFQHEETPAIDWPILLQHPTHKKVTHPFQTLPPLKEFLSYTEQERQQIFSFTHLQDDAQTRQYLLADYAQSKQGGILRNSLQQTVYKRTPVKRWYGYSYNKVEHPVVIELRKEKKIESNIAVATASDTAENKLSLTIRDGQLPTTLSSATKTTHLTIRGNIKDLTPVFSLVNLQSLQIEHSTIQKNFPNLFHQLPNLTHLRLRSVSLPPGIIAAPRLEKADIHNSIITKLDFSKSPLVNLMLQGTRINGPITLPHTLQFLSLAKTTGAPKHIDFDMTPNLVGLWLNHSGYKKVPPSITELRDLERLNLANNDISESPEGLSKLTKLKWLSTKKTNIELSTQIITQLQLEYLNIDRAPTPHCWPTTNCTVIGPNLSTVRKEMLPIPQNITVEEPILRSRLSPLLPEEYATKPTREAINYWKDNNAKA